MPAAIIQDPVRAAAALRAGQLVALPTETVYGLGANALDPAAVAGVFAAKDRPRFDPLILHQGDADRVFRYAASVPEAARRLAAACWPGPLTLVLPKASAVSDLVSAGLPTVALRVPAHPLTARVLELVDFPVAAPSANPFGYVSPTSARHVADQLGDKIDLILDGGDCRVGLESTIVGFPGGEVTIFRKGGTTVEDIEAILGHSVAVRTHSNSRPDAPGMLSRHYSPGVEMRILAPGERPGNRLPGRSAHITFGTGGPAFAHLPEPDLDRYDLSPAGRAEEAATRLFRTLRTVATRGYRVVFVDLLPETGLGRAVNDRLRRAASRE